MRLLTDLSEYNAIVEKYHQKGCFSNDYIQQRAACLIADNLLFAETYAQNAFLFVKRDSVGIRVYYYINDLEEKAVFSGCENLVVEILFRSDLPQAEMDYLIGCGFRTNLVRDLYGGMYRELEKSTSPFTYWA